MGVSGGRLRLIGTALADTSLFIAQEQGRELRARPPERIAVSVVTIAELRWGVLSATETDIAARRLDTLLRVQRLDPLPIDEDVAAEWASLRVGLRRLGRRMPRNDAWIAATARAWRMPVVTQDHDYDDIPGLEVLQL